MMSGFDIFILSVVLIAVLLMLFSKRSWLKGLGLIVFSVILIQEALVRFNMSLYPVKGKFSKRIFISDWLMVGEEHGLSLDSIRGYRFEPNASPRMIRWVNDKKTFNYHLDINNEGWISKIDYSDKKDSTTKRYLVFGDSFTAGWIMDSTWVDRMNHLSREAGLSVEFYNYSIDGGGISNWYSIYFNEIRNKVQHDGVIIAPYLDNLNRKFIAHFPEEECIKVDYFYDKADLATMPHQATCTYKVLNRDQFDVYEQDYFENYNRLIHNNRLYISMLLTGVLVKGDARKLGFNDYYGAYVKQGAQLAFEDLDDRDYNHQNGLSVNFLHFLDTMVVSEMAVGNDVYLAMIPDKFISSGRQSPDDKETYEKDMKVIAAHYDVPLYNGNDLFAKYSRLELEELYHKEDMHWNADGARIYAEAFFEYFTALIRKRDDQKQNQSL